MKIDPSQIKELRRITGVGVMDCKNALEEALGDIKKAEAMLQEKARAIAMKKEDKETKAGIVEAYIHGDGRIGVLIEVHCETDFLSKSADFKSLVRDLTLQIASEAPKYAGVKDVPPEVIEDIGHKAESEALAAGKSAVVASAIREGKVRKFLSRACLMEQKFIKNPEIAVSRLIQTLTAKSGENIRVVNFARYEINT